jgi:Uma2 family endonuclease
MSTAAPTVLMTAEEYLALGDESRSELVRGRVVPMTPPGFRHGSVCSRLVRLIGRFLDDHDLGHLVSNDAGVITQRDPDTVRGPDLAFFSYDRLPREQEPVGYPAVAPDLVFEVLSPTDRMSDVLDKVAEYLQSHVRVVCLVDPASRHVEVFRGEQSLQHFAITDRLLIPDVLPGFELPVKSLFPV